MEEFLAAGMHWKILNFLLFAGLLFFLLRKPVKEFWTSRSHQIKFDKEEAEKMRQEAEKAYHDLEKRVLHIEKEAHDLIHAMERDGELEKAKLVEEASKLADRIKRDSEKIMSQELRKAKEGLKEKMVELSLELAETLIYQNKTEADQKRLSEHYLASLERESL